MLLIDTHSKIQHDLENFFCDMISPLNIKYLQCSDSWLNFKTVFATNIEELDTVTSVYNIPSLMRVLLEKSNIINEQSINELFTGNSTEICFILDWSTQKKILVFSLDGAKHFADMQFSKEIILAREYLIELFSGVTNE